MADLITALGTGLSAVSTNAQNVIGTVLPIALGIFALTWALKKAPTWFKQMGANK